MEILTELESNTKIGKDKKKPKRTDKDVINIIRTTLRNSIELTAIADNKANVLLTLNALMITFLMPLVLSNLERLTELVFFIPLIVLALTCITTIYLCTQVLKPGDFKKIKNEKIKEGKRYSPFFFGNYHDMNRTELLPYMKEVLVGDDNLQEFLADDLFYIGRRLAIKMTIIQSAFNVFMIGLAISLLSAGVLLLTH